MNHRRSLAIIAIISSVFMTGCTFNAGYNPAYLPSQPMAMGIAGKGLVVQTAADAQWTYSGHPTSFTGHGTTLTMPIGEITKQIALKVFGAAFAEGADFRNSPENVSGYRLIIEPHVNKFTYAYNQLKNLGFAVTPQVDLDLQVKLTGASGKVLIDKTYASGLVDGDTYALSGKPGEKVNQLIHQVIFKLMTDAALDAKQMLAQNETASAAK